MTEAKPITISVEELDKVRDGWALAIGRFLVAFTSCEFWTYLYIQTFGSTRMREAVSDLSLAARSKIALALVSGIELTDEMQTRVNTAFSELDRLAKRRNLVAHNGPMVHVYRHTESGALEVRHELRSARDETKDMTIPELERLHVEASELDQELALLYGLVRQPASRKRATIRS